MMRISKVNLWIGGTSLSMLDLLKDRIYREH